MHHKHMFAHFRKQISFPISTHFAFFSECTQISRMLMKGLWSLKTKPKTLSANGMWQGEIAILSKIKFNSIIYPLQMSLQSD